MNLSLFLRDNGARVRKLGRIAQAHPLPTASVVALSLLPLILAWVAPGSPRPSNPLGWTIEIGSWGPAALLLPVVGLWIRQRAGLGTMTWGAVFRLTGREIRLALGYLGLSLLVLLPTWLPPVILGAIDGFSGMTTRYPWLSGYEAISASILGAFVQYLFLWSFPALVFFPHKKIHEVHRWARHLSRKTWGIALAFGLGGCLGWWIDSAWGGLEVWQALGLAAANILWGAQALWLSEAARRPEFGPQA